MRLSLDSLKTWNSESIREKEVRKGEEVQEDCMMLKEDLQSTYPQLNKKEIKLLYLKLQKWRYSKVGNKRLASNNNCLNPKD